MAMKNPTSIAHRPAYSIALYRRDYGEAVAEAERAIALESNDAVSNETMGRALIYSGRPKEVVDFLKRAMQLDPRNPGQYLCLFGLVHFRMGELEEALTSFERGLTHSPELLQYQAFVAASYAHLGRDQEARVALDKYMKT